MIQKLKIIQSKSKLITKLTIHRIKLAKKAVLQSIKKRIMLLVIKIKIRLIIIKRINDYKKTNIEIRREG
jgi:hypothetical protein